jgi:5-oxoprolinase (ATP-hydrolysing)
VARAAGCELAIGFDMGGTSTDVSLIRRGEVERGFETQVGGVRVKAPMLRVHSVAAGGGSLCRFDGFRLTVGPESAGADPGPLCYGRAAARELTLTDVNLLLGRVQPDRFPFALERGRAESALAALAGELTRAGHELAGDALAAGFVAVANAGMAQAIAEVTVARGVDPRECALVAFGGAAGQHACALARELGIRTLLLHPLGGVLSAFGIAGAELAWDGQRDAGRVLLGELPDAVREAWAALEREARAALAAQGAAASELRIERLLDLRYAGTETALAVAEPPSGDFAAAFAAEHAARFGYTRPGRAIEIATARLAARAPARSPRAGARAARPQPAARGEPAALRHEPVWFPGAGRVPAPVFAREALRAGQVLRGPALVLEAGGTLVLDPGFAAELGPEGILVVRDEAGPARAAEGDLSRLDPVRLEVFGNRFMSIAERMGAVLRNTSVSTNIKERLDYSCAVFDERGGLVANAPHIPVHLGAMSETVRGVRERFPDLAPGDCVVTNDPAAGGSHLPDVTVVLPVFAGSPRPAFYVASRGHHADLGGIAPGSMPADSRSLAEEGVLIPPLLLVRDGRLAEQELLGLLSAPPHPARAPADNLAELEAMVAANRAGERLLGELVAEHGLPLVSVTMRQVQEAAAAKVAREIGRLADGVFAFRDRMDDGTPVCVRIEIAGERMTIDFAGTGGPHPGNLNAPRAVVQAAVIYVLRSLVAERIPLNGGCLDPVEIRIPERSLLDPPPGAAVVGGNVETSQRLVDVLLGALGKAAASQGTMNNVAFGDERFGYYETIGGGAGAGPGFAGASGVHVHMTNTRITDAEVLEARHPVRVLEFRLRRGSGGAGRWPGGDGLVRRYEFLAPVEVSILAERRAVAPFGLAGGLPGATGFDAVERRDGEVEPLSGRARTRLAPGDRLRVETPGGGGWGAPADASRPDAAPCFGVAAGRPAP